MSIVERRFSKLYLALGHSFARPELLEEALTHASALAGPSAGRRDYERLEFLGDRVLNLVVAQLLLKRYPEEKVGQISRRHAALVREESLARVAQRIGLAEFVRLSRGEEDAKGRVNPAILADCCEAVIAALYLDGGAIAAERFIVGQWGPMMNEALKPPKDAKTALQEWCQSRGLPLPAYELVGVAGPDHDPVFTVAATVRGLPRTSAEGRSKRAAEQVAAEHILRIALAAPPSA